MTEPSDGDRLEGVEIREVTREDAGPLRDLLERVDAFRADEVECALEVVEEFLEGDRDYRPFLLWEEGRAAGFVCFGKVPLTRTTYDLYWIAVDPEFRGRGHGGTLMRVFLEGVRGEGGRLAVIETSSLPGYSDARRLYLRHGFQEKARLEGYYGEGDDLIIYSLGLPPEER